MRLLIEKDDGAVVEVSEIQSIPSDCNALLFRPKWPMTLWQEIRLEYDLRQRTGMKCLVLHWSIRDVIGAHFTPKRNNKRDQ